MNDRARTVLFLCTGNSARSILAEAVLGRLGKDRFRALSAGSRPKGEVHPDAVRTLIAHGFATGEFRSKSWDEFAAADAPRIDVVITLCDSAANETCPVWPGGPVTVHWGLPDPAAVSDPTERLAAFEETFAAMTERLRHFVAIPFDTLDGDALQRRLNEIAVSGTEHP